MTRPRLATTPAILGLAVSGLILGIAGCNSDHSGLGLPNLDAQAPGRDAAAGRGGAGGAGRDAPIAGGGSGGVVESGGVTVMGGSSQAEAGSGGSTPSGGAIGGFTAGGTGGSTPKGGITAGGATQAGGSGGTTVAGGAGGTAGVIVSGGTRTGGVTSASGGTLAGGAASGGTRTGGTAGSGGSTPAGGGASGGMLTGGATGTGGTSSRMCGAGLKSCMTNEFCEMPTGLCDSSSATGTCLATPGACGDVYQPVCGCDGMTYTNDCERQVAHVSRKSYGACAAPDAGAGGSGGSGGSTAIGGRTATGGMSTGGTGAGGVGGSSGGHPECVTASDCQLFSDCCNCVPIPKGSTSTPSCTIAGCFASACASRQIQASEVACVAGRCTFSRACKPAAGICPVTTLTPQCPAGQAPLFVGSCPSGGCAKVEDCSEVSSCDVCNAGTSAAPTGLLCATFQTLPPSYHCVSTPAACGTSPTCACMGICSGDMSCITPDSTTLTCQCPNC